MLSLNSNPLDDLLDFVKVRRDLLRLDFVDALFILRFCLLQKVQVLFLNFLDVLLNDLILWHITILLGF